MIAKSSKGLHRLKSYCCEPIENIDGYAEAVASPEKYELHHLKEDEGYTKQQLIDMGQYYNQPASLLVFMPMLEHRKHHNKNNPMKGRKQSEETKKKISAANSGRKRSVEYKKMLSERYSGKNNPMYGTHRSMPKGKDSPSFKDFDVEEARKMRESGMTYSEIGKHFNVCGGTIKNRLK